MVILHTISLFQPHSNNELIFIFADITSFIDKFEENVKLPEHHTQHNQVYTPVATTDKLSNMVKSSYLGDITHILDRYK